MKIDLIQSKLDENSEHSFQVEYDSRFDYFHIYIDEVFKYKEDYIPDEFIYDFSFVSKNNKEIFLRLYASLEDEKLEEVKNQAINILKEII